MGWRKQLVVSLLWHCELKLFKRADISHSSVCSLFMCWFCTASYIFFFFFFLLIGYAVNSSRFSFASVSILMTCLFELNCKQNGLSLKLHSVKTNEITGIAIMYVRYENESLSTTMLFIFCVDSSSCHYLLHVVS